MTLPLVLALALAVQQPAWVPAADSAFRGLEQPGGPGCALGVVERGELRHARGFGLANIEHRVSNTPGTAFYIASTSKQFTALAVALLAAEGRLDLDAPVRRWIPELPEYAAGITARHLVHHTSGLRDYLSLWSLSGRTFNDAVPLQDALVLIGRQRQLNFAPGAEHLYSNSGYLLLAVLVERVTGRPLSAFAEERFFRPAGMTNTRFRDDRALPIRDRADGHMMSGGGWQVFRTSFDLVGDGGLVTTVEDLARWERWFWDGPERSDLRARVLTRGRLTSGDSIPYAFGLVHGTYRGQQTVAHGGAFLGFLAEVLRFPQHRTSIIVLCNTFTGNPSLRARRVADAVLSAHLGPRDSTPATPTSRGPTPITMTDAELSQYAGRYVSDELQAVYTVRADSGRLVAAAGAFQARVIPVAPDSFRVGGLSLVFSRDGDRRVTGLMLTEGRARGIEFRRQ